jgi:beta-glucosidase
MNDGDYIAVCLSLNLVEWHSQWASEDIRHILIQPKQCFHNTFQIAGMQSKPGVGATIKHFCCNNQEDNRFGVNENVSERALREIYLRGFEIAVKESKPLALMTSYNQLNGAYTGYRRDLVTDILRCEWGYKGLVMTDWGTKYDPAAALHAQVDMMMPGADADRDAVLAGLADGSITPAEVRRDAARVLTLIEQSLTAKL